MNRVRALPVALLASLMTLTLAGCASGDAPSPADERRLEKRRSDARKAQDELTHEVTRRLDAQ